LASDASSLVCVSKFFSLPEPLSPGQSFRDGLTEVLPAKGGSGGVEEPRGSSIGGMGGSSKGGIDGSVEERGGIVEEGIADRVEESAGSVEEETADGAKGGIADGVEGGIGDRVIYGISGSVERSEVAKLRFIPREEL